MPQLFFTDLSAVHRSVTVDGTTYELSSDEIAAAGSIGLIDGMPFILGSDGAYDHHLNRFLRACPTMGVRSMNSLRAYARDILVWMRFLEECRNGKSLWSADRDDIAAFHEARFCSWTLRFEASCVVSDMVSRSWRLNGSVAMIEAWISPPALVHGDGPAARTLDDRRANRGSCCWPTSGSHPNRPPIRTASPGSGVPRHPRWWPTAPSP